MLACQYSYTCMPVYLCLHDSIPTPAWQYTICMLVYLHLHASIPTLVCQFTYMPVCPKSPGHTGMLANTPMPYTGMNGIIIPL